MTMTTTKPFFPILPFLPFKRRQRQPLVRLCILPCRCLFRRDLVLQEVLLLQQHLLRLAQLLNGLARGGATGSFALLASTFASTEHATHFSKSQMWVLCEILITWFTKVEED